MHSCDNAYDIVTGIGLATRKITAEHRAELQSAISKTRVAGVLGHRISLLDVFRDGMV